MACVSNGLRFFSPLRSSRPVEGLIRFSTAASGTSLTRTQIFTWFTLLAEWRRASYCDSSPIDLSVNREVEHALDHLLAQVARGGCEPQEVGKPQPVRGEPGQRGAGGVVAVGDPGLPLRVALADALEGAGLLHHGGEQGELGRTLGGGPAAHVRRADVAGCEAPGAGVDLRGELLQPALEHGVEQV